MGRFIKGQSGNPGGRPKDTELREACRAKTNDAVETLDQIMKNGKAPEHARVAAACAILDRGYGKPTQGIDMSLSDHRYVISQYTDEELQQIIAGKKVPLVSWRENPETGMFENVFENAETEPGADESGGTDGGI